MIIGDDLPRLYLAVVFEYREGGDLAKSMKNEQRDENEWSEFYLRILKQLIWIHDRGFIHADIKPGMSRNYYFYFNEIPIYWDKDKMVQILI